jgi:hypothetical protein
VYYNHLRIPFLSSLSPDLLYQLSHSQPRHSPKTDATQRRVLQTLDDLFLSFLIPLTLPSSAINRLDVFLCKMDIPNGEVPLQPVLSGRGRNNDCPTRETTVSSSDGSTRRGEDVPLGSTPRKQHLLRLRLDPDPNIRNGLIDRPTLLRGQRNKGRISLGLDVLFVHVFEQRGLLVDYIGVEEDCRGC